MTVKPGEIQDPTVVPDPEVPPPAEPPAAPPAEPPAAPPAASAAPAEPAAAPAPAQAQLTEEQWVALEKSSGLPRTQIILQQAQINAALAASGVTSLVEERALNQVKGDPEKKDFSKYESEIKARLLKLQPALRQDPKVVEEVYFLVKGQAMSRPAAAPAAPAAPGRRMVVSPSSGDGVEPPAPGEGDLNGLSTFDQHLAKRYGMKSVKEFKENASRTVDTSYEQDWKPDFGR